MTTGYRQQESASKPRGWRARWAIQGAIALTGVMAAATTACGPQTPPQATTSSGTGMVATAQGPSGIVPNGQMGGAQVLGGVNAANQMANGQVLVNCGPGQQTLVRPVLMNGQAVSQVECVAASVPVNAPYGVAPGTAYAPVGQVAPAASYVSYQEPERVVVPSRARAASTARRASYRTADDYVEYAPARTRSGRSWKKSAIIIGSSAGIGAGVGAATGGKKGALIGAAIGGGGAAIWDQVTRNRDKQ